jgi:DNA end-binding protein Ku
MARAIWKGAISFGMVVIPVKMYTATQSKDLSFNLLHKKCLRKGRQVRYCPTCEEYFGLSETVKGYEFAKGRYVTIEENDLQRVPVKTVHTIAISGFADAQEIDPVYYHNSYYLEPEELGAKPFFLFKEALTKMHRIAIAKVTFQGKEHLCCLRPLTKTIILHTMYYHDEIHPTNELTLPQEQAKFTSEELSMATTLIDAMAKEFKPEEYKDEYRLALGEIIQAKIRGEEITAPVVAPGKVTDLMSALRASIKAAKKSAAREKALPEEMPARET